MTMYDYDIVTVGGGVGGASLAWVMAAQGYRVLVADMAPPTAEQRLKIFGR